MAIPSSSNTATISSVSALPTYMHEVYEWAYLNPRNVGILDNEIVVSTILWGNYKRLKQVVLDEIKPNMSVLQVAHVYGSLIPEMARCLNEDGKFELIDISPLQITVADKKLGNLPNVTTRIADATNLNDEHHDLVNCFFLLHEIPDDYKRRVVDTLLSKIKPDGTLIIVDYHKPHRLNPVKPIMRFIFHWFEPFAKELWEHDIQDYATNPDQYSWHKETIFGGLYQKLIVKRKPET
ncbi:MAG: methyltransferase domain-containing protein [Rhodospirillales bacterium]|jgi:ubiquinone/menaquinone biosynthesis C-methylase UbiE|nr:methyltransferase domain-containing protein [Rhodospirillales bacterium]